MSILLLELEQMVKMKLPTLSVAALYPRRRSVIFHHLLFDLVCFLLLPFPLLLL
jgi:hypothetical protein